MFQNVVTYSYKEYWDLIRKLMSENKTTGNNHSEEYLGYTKLNIQRMERQDNKVVITDELKNVLINLKFPQTWYVITEWWCGDASQNLPTIAKMVETTPDIELKIILRDENLPIIDTYLTGGSRSIPKLIAFKKGEEIVGKELFIWGPRPVQAHQLLLEYKSNPNSKDLHAFHEDLHKWYFKDNNQSIQNEFILFILNLKLNLI